MIELRIQDILGEYSVNAATSRCLHATYSVTTFATSEHDEESRQGSNRAGSRQKYKTDSIWGHNPLRILPHG